MTDEGIFISLRRVGRPRLRDGSCLCANAARCGAAPVLLAGGQDAPARGASQFPYFLSHGHRPVQKVEVTPAHSEHLRWWLSKPRRRRQDRPADQLEYLR
jgi:hypothetical protein